MRSILLRLEPGTEEPLAAELWEHGTVGIIEEPQGWRAFFEDGQTLPLRLHLDGASIIEEPHGWRAFFEVGQSLPLRLHLDGASIIETREEMNPDPADFPKQNWDPLLVGNRFWIAPSWVRQSTPPGRMRLAIDNPSAFGTGRHETTQLALEALEQHLTAADTVLDIGSGSGILSQAALMLGARSVFSCDIYPEAIAASRALLQSRLFLGTAEAIRSQTADIVLANISAKVVDALSWELKRITKPNALLVVTGFLRDNPPIHFTPEKVLERNDWLCWLCRPDGITNVQKPYVHPLQWW